MPEDPNNPTPTPPTPPAEPTPPSAPTPPPTETPPTPPPAPSVDKESLSKEISDSVSETVSKSLLEKIGGALGLTQKEKEGLPTDKEELANFVREQGRKGAEEVLTEREKQEQKESEQREQQLTEGANRFQTLWQRQYNELSEAGKVPKIEKADDLNDPGNQAKTKILLKLKQILDENEKNGVDYVPTVKEIFYEFPEVLQTNTTDGANTPISGGGRSTTPNKGLSYEQLHKTPIEEMVREKETS